MSHSTRQNGHFVGRLGAVVEYVFRVIPKCTVVDKSFQFSFCVIRHYFNGSLELMGVM